MPVPGIGGTGTYRKLGKEFILPFNPSSLRILASEGLKRARGYPGGECVLFRGMKPTSFLKQSIPIPPCVFYTYWDHMAALVAVPADLLIHLRSSPN